MNTNQYMKKLAAKSFAFWDVHLYLDTHPKDMQAMALRNRLEREYKAARNEYIEHCGPLTVTDVNCERWAENPWPWDIAGCDC